MVSVVFPAPLMPTNPHTLTCGNMQVETVEDLRAHATVRVEEVDVLKVDRAFAHHKLWRARLVRHQARLVQNLGHAGRIAERAVETLQAVVDEVELVRDGVQCT